MKRHRLDVLAAISLLILAGVLCGYVSVIGPVLGRYIVTTKSYTVWTLTAEEGRVRALWVTGATWTKAAPPPGLHFHWIWPTRFQPPGMKYLFWEFDAHAFQSGSVHFAILACPIWCVALPCLIAPVLWLRRRRKNRGEGPGFAVLAASVDAPQ